MIWSMKKNIVIFIIAVGLLFVLTSGNLNKGYSAESDVERIGIISAMDNEISVLLKEADINHEDMIGGVKYYIGKLRGKDEVITSSLSYTSI